MGVEDDQSKRRLLGLPTAPLRKEGACDRSGLRLGMLSGELGRAADPVNRFNGAQLS